MQDNSVKSFKYDLRTYREKIKQIGKLHNAIEECYYILGGVKGVDPSKEPIHSPPNIDAEHAIRERIEVLRAKLKRLRAQTDEIEYTMARIEKPLSDAIIAVYVDGRTLLSVSRDMYISTNGLLKRMNKAIKKALEY